MTSTPGYTELHCHSAFSLLNGASLPEKLVERAVSLGLSGLALTDKNDMGGLVRFAQRARELADFPAIIGAEVTLRTHDIDHELVLLARTAAGYSNLSTLITLARLHQPRGQPSITWTQLERYRGGLFCLSGGPQGALIPYLAQDDRLGLRRMAGRLADLFGEFFAVELMDHGLPEEATWCEGLMTLSAEIDRPWVVTNHVHYGKKAERIVHDVLTCLRHQTTLDQAGDRLKANGEWHLKSPALMLERWRHHPQGLWATLDIANRCNFRLHDIHVPLPKTEQASQYKSQDEHLKCLTMEGAQRRWGYGLTQWHRQQLDKELSLIERRSLSGYFLIMWEIVEFARRQNILVQGRGSAANSAVCYCLGITAVDPIRHDLLFERFLSDAREGYPDIDLDIEHTRREEVIQFVYERYGRTHAAMVCAHNCFRLKGAVRDAARVLGFESTEVARLAATVKRGVDLDVDAIDKEGFDLRQTRVRALVQVVTALRGVPRHRSTHVGGFVLSTRPISEIVAVEPAAMEGRTIIQWDKDDLDQMAIPKFDLLGLGMLSALSKGLALVRRRYELPAYLYSLPDRQEVYDMIAQADTVGVFQIESRAQMNSLPRTRPTTLYELAIQVALIRPGPLQGDMVHPYIRRKRGEEPIDLIHPTLAPILRRTLGVPLFQEQGMRLAVEAAGLTPDDAERLRRAISSQRHRHRLGELLEKLRLGLRRRGIADETTERIIKQIQSFSTYGFPESHSTSFALLVYASSWLKCFYPAEFLCALMNSQPMGFYSNDSLIKDAQRHGVEVKPPCLKQSAWLTTMESSAVRLGLHQVNGLGPHAKNALENARQQGPFVSDVDVIRRVALPLETWKVLAEAGAFEQLIPGHRRDAVWRVLYLAKTASDGLPLCYSENSQIEFRAPSPAENAQSDYKTKQLTVGPHVMTYVRDALQAKGVRTAAELRTFKNGQWAKTAGRIIARQRPETAKGFMFISLEDETGFTNVIIHPKVFHRHHKLLVLSIALIIEGPIAYEQDVWNLKGIRFAPLRLPGDDHSPAIYSFR
ncbi:MAG: error-prone DNA polymerase [Myxococcota bacterium]|nr:error-prone DNA polymerase [Myxococcota bacterium]